MYGVGRNFSPKTGVWMAAEGSSEVLSWREEKFRNFCQSFTPALPSSRSSPLARSFGGRKGIFPAHFSFLLKICSFFNKNILSMKCRGILLVFLSAEKLESVDDSQ